MKAFTGILDQDREILLNIQNDKELLETCSLNKYLYNQVCNDMFFRNRLTRTYPDSLKYKPSDYTWKKYFLKTIYYVAKLKEQFKYDYVEGDPKEVYHVFEISYYEAGKDVEEFYRLLALNSLASRLKKVFDYTLEKAQPNSRPYILQSALTRVSITGNPEMFKYVVEKTNKYNIELEMYDALLASVQFGNMDIVKYIMENYNIDREDLNIAIMKAERFDELEIVDYLQNQL